MLFIPTALIQFLQAFFLIWLIAVIMWRYRLVIVFLILLMFKLFFNHWRLLFYFIWNLMLLRPANIVRCIILVRVFLNVALLTRRRDLLMLWNLLSHHTVRISFFQLLFILDFISKGLFQFKAKFLKENNLRIVKIEIVKIRQLLHSWFNLW